MEIGRNIWGRIGYFLDYHTYFSHIPLNRSNTYNTITKQKPSIFIIKSSSKSPSIHYHLIIIHHLYLYHFLYKTHLSFSSTKWRFITFWGFWVLEYFGGWRRWRLPSISPFDLILHLRVVFLYSILFYCKQHGYFIW